MGRALCLAIGLVILSTMLQSSQRLPVARSAVEDELIAVQQAQITANNAADVATLDRLTAADWTGVSAAGIVQEKAQFLEEVVKRGPARVQRTMEDAADRQKAWRVQVSGTLGVVTRLTAGDHGSRMWNTAVWTKRDGVWLRVFSQGTTAAAQ